MKLSYSIFIFVVTIFYQLNFSLAEYSVTGTQVLVKPKSEGPVSINVLDYTDPTTTTTTTFRPFISLILTHALPLTDSNCFCSYNGRSNVLSCSPSLYNCSSFPLAFTNVPLINVTLNGCTFFTNHFNLPIIKRKNIDHLQLYNINSRDYLVFDATSLSPYTINHIHISYSFTQPITMLLISNETFSSSSIRLSLRTFHIESCYLLTLHKPLNRLFLLESITFIDIQQFSWYDFQQQIVNLPKLRWIYIGEEIVRTNKAIVNVLSCQDISSQWMVTYRSIQTCSCKLNTFLKTIRRIGDLFQCPNSDNTIDFIDDICQFNGTEYQIYNQTDRFCNKCLSSPCPDGTLCTEALDSGPNCVLLIRYDYETIRARIPLTPFTKQFLLQESHDYLSINSNQTLQLTGFNSIATILIDSNQNHTENSPTDCQMFHQTFSEMLNRPWSPAIYQIGGPSMAVWQQLLISLDDSVKNINDSESKFEFESKPISTISLRFPTDQQPQNSFGWKIANDNKITSNISNSELIDKNITSHVFLKFNNNQQFIPTCDTANAKGNCTNRFSITSIKSQKLFYNTDRFPEYDVISIVAPSQDQEVTFYFDQKVASTDRNTYVTNATIITTNSFYDQLDVMISEGSCMYLNTSSMIWQTDGCTTDRQLSNSTSVTCTCEHLTMFTVFFSLSCATPSKALDILSWIGCSLSLFGLSITLIMFIVITQCQRTKNSNNGISLSSHNSSSQELRRRIMSKPRRLSMVKSMLFVLCILLILMNILIFILTFIKSGQNLGCTIFSASLYYFTLTAFLWKLLFSFQQSLFLTNIFQPYWSDRTLLIIYSSLTFSLPIFPLVIMFIKYKNSTFISSTCNYCWLTREFLLYGLIIPIIAIICLILILYLYTMIHLCIRNRQQAGLRSTKSDHSRHMQNFKIGLFFAIIMGLSWILAFLILIPNSYVQFIGNILFCIVNSLQGLAFSIMVFCMLERKSFRKCCCFWRYKNTKNIPSIIPQLSIPTLNEDNDNKMKTMYNSSTFTTSTTSTSGENNNHEKVEHYRIKRLPTEKEEDEDEHIYSLPRF